jgi:hypothetical protein
VSRKSKLKFYWSVIRPIVVYGCETWVLKESIIQRLSVFERKILKKIFGPTKEDNCIRRIKTNMELDELIKHRNIMNYVKSQRLSWFRHINRMPETSVVRKIYKWKPYTGRPTGSTKSRWEDDVGNDNLLNGQNMSKIAPNGKLLLRKPRLYRSCSAEEEDV